MSITAEDLLALLSAYQPIAGLCASLLSADDPEFACTHLGSESDPPALSYSRNTSSGTHPERPCESRHHAHPARRSTTSTWSPAATVNSTVS